MTRMSAVAVMAVFLLSLGLAGCTIQPVQSIRPPEVQVDSAEPVDYTLNPELRFLLETPVAERAVDATERIDFVRNPELRFLLQTPSAEAVGEASEPIDYALNPELRFLLETPATSAAVDATESIDYALNPELRFLQERPAATASARVGSLPAVYSATGIDSVAGEWLFESEGGQEIIRLARDGTISRLVDSSEAVDLGEYWFSDGEFHVVGAGGTEVEESVFHVVVEADQDGTRLRFELCGGNCADAASVEWLHGLTQVQSEG